MLTDKEVIEVRKAVPFAHEVPYADTLAFAHALLDAHRAKYPDTSKLWATLVKDNTKGYACDFQKAADELSDVVRAQYASCPNCGYVHADVAPDEVITRAVDLAMVEMQGIVPPLKRSDCERLIRASRALGAPYDKPKNCWAGAGRHESEARMTTIFWLTCEECSLTQPMQPCEACPNRNAQGLK